MEFIKQGTQFDFMQLARRLVYVSSALVIVSLGLVLTVGFDSGIDFKGGTKVIAEFKADGTVDRGALKTAVDALVQKQTGEAGTQVEVQDFDVGGASDRDTVKYQIFTELPSLLTPLKKLGLAKEVEKHFGVGTMVETPFEAGDKFYVYLPAEWPLAAAGDEIRKVFGAQGFQVTMVSDKEQAIRTEMLRETDLLLSAQDDQVKAEAAKVRADAEAKIAGLSDSRYTVEVQAIKDLLAQSMKDTFGASFVEVLSTASVSPSVGKELFQTAMLAMFYAIIGILIYIALRFDLKFAPGAILCLVHDVIIIFGIMVVFDVKFTLPIVASILTLIGYDINDTIVVYDRIRENLQKGRAGDLGKIINLSINETLSRTIMTSGFTALTIVSIWWFGGGTISDFAFLFFIGIFLGTYSSIFIAAPLTLYLEKITRRRARLARA
jgi:preprotein translocase subunit SecF